VRRLCASGVYRRWSFMHSVHTIFVQAIQNCRKIKLTYFDNEIKLNLTKLSIPLHHRPLRVEGVESDFYYFWMSKADECKRFLRLSASQILSMDLTDEAFDLGKLTINEGGTERRPSSCALGCIK